MIKRERKNKRGLAEYELRKAKVDRFVRENHRGYDLWMADELAAGVKKLAQVKNPRSVEGDYTYLGRQLCQNPALFRMVADALEGEQKPSPAAACYDGPIEKAHNEAVKRTTHWTKIPTADLFVRVFREQNPMKHLPNRVKHAKNKQPRASSLLRSAERLGLPLWRPNIGRPKGT